MEGRAAAEVESRIRPVGLVEPEDAELLRALRDWEHSQRTNGKPAAITQLDSLDGRSNEDAAWSLIVRGLVLAEGARLADAESMFLQAAARSLIAATGDHRPSDDESVLRLVARALNHLGCVYRRQDRADMAETAHLTSLDLRDRFGSFEELWETADELGLDGDVARRLEDARRWHEKAIAFAERAAVKPLVRQAVSWTHLSLTLGKLGEFEEAVSAARTALELWRRYAPGDAIVAQAEHHLAQILVRTGEHFSEQGGASGRRALEEAMELLGKSCAELSAFGPVHDAEAASCRYELDFAGRLMAGMSS